MIDSGTTIGRMRSAVSSRRPDAFRQNLLRDCDRMEASLMPIARHSMWDAPMIPLDRDGMRDLLELKNIALLYELWTFFRLVHEISAVLGRPPVRSGRPGQRSLPDRFRSWRDLRMGSGRAPGVQPALLQVTQRTRALLLRAADSRHRPFDPRWAERRPPPVRREVRVQALNDVGLAADDRDADDEKAAERAGSFKRADIYKMHAYRDAIPEARSVWILYPGGEFRFFGVGGGGGEGMGANDGVLRATLRCSWGRAGSRVGGWRGAG